MAVTEKVAVPPKETVASVGGAVMVGGLTATALTVRRTAALRVLPPELVTRT